MRIHAWHILSAQEYYYAFFLSLPNWKWFFFFWTSPATCLKRFEITFFKKLFVRKMPIFGNHLWPTPHVFCVWEEKLIVEIVGGGDGKTRVTLLFTWVILFTLICSFKPSWPFRSMRLDPTGELLGHLISDTINFLNSTTLNPTFPSFLPLLSWLRFLFLAWSQPLGLALF